MAFRHNSRNRNHAKAKNVGYEEEPRPTIPLPADIYVDQDAAAAGEIQLKHWLDEKYEDFVNSGGYDQLPGKGKPLVIPTGSVLDSILKQAGVPHPWVLLRLTIREDIEETAALAERQPDHPEIEGRLADLNQRIAKYNLEAPSPALHRRKLTRENLSSEQLRWE